MFRFKKKTTDETPVEELGSRGGALRGNDGGYDNPAADTDAADLKNNNNNNNKKNYESTQDRRVVAGRPSVYASRRLSTLNHLHDPQGGQKVWVEPPDMGSSDASSTVPSTTVVNEKDNRCCGGSPCFGLSDDQRLLVMAIGLFVMMSGIIIGLVIIFTVLRSPTVCNTPDCIIAAGEILRSLDQSVDPCEDFVQFSCGGWQRQHPVPAAMMGWDRFSVAADTMHFMLKELLEEPQKSEDTKAVNITKTFYRACVNQTAWEAEGVGPLISELNKVGGFPMINTSWSDAEYNWLENVISIRKNFAADYLISVGVTYDSKNSSLYVIHIGEGYLPSPREYILSNDTRIKTMELQRISAIVQTLGASAEKVATSRAGLKSHKLIHPLGSPSEEENNDQEKDDDLLEKIIQFSKHVEKMQMSRKETVITFDGIAPNLNNINAKLPMHQKDEQAERLKTRQSSPLETDLYDLYDFIYNLTKLTMNSEQTQDQYRLYNPMTVAELQDRTDALPGNLTRFDWLHYINSVFGDTGIVVTDQERIIVTSPHYIDNVLVLLDSTPSRVIANFLSYMMSLNLGEEAAAGFSGLRTALGMEHQRMTRYIGRKEIRPWYDCSAKANMLLSSGVAYMFLKTQFSEETLVETKEMVSDVHSSFRTSLIEADWMDDETKTAGLKKLDEMLQLVGYGENATNATAIDARYKDLPPLSDKHHFANILSIARHLSNNSLTILRHTPTRDEFTTDPVNINAFYSFAQNAMLIPAGILQPPFYRKNTVRALNYGGIGIVIGHEISHGFDDSGKEVDEKGNLRKWWTKESNATYHDKAQCFVEQYEQYPQQEDLHGENLQLLGLKLNGKITQGENIADNGGIQVAFRAYEKRAQLEYENIRLPGLLEYSGAQLFFISFAQLWCSNYTPRGLKSAIQLGAHAPGPYRVKGCFQNTAQMKTAFQCSKDTSANATETCRLW